eukprot:TRINITY_DN35098_c0_g1_i1.p1 TRINITY_DN35098_c0_g1~~TRINITY_DN35098_c0_g1_i1.p1  ORF type:complete len:515 (+),score=77.71 TRINITY_DN35098_c0_g1_i1:111-1655(+)
MTAASSDKALIVVATKNAAGDDPDLQKLAAIDARFASRVVAVPSAEHKRLILSPCGELQAEVDDVRRVGEAAAAGALEAFSMGATSLSLELDTCISSLQHPTDGSIYGLADLVAGLAVHQAAYMPLQAREGKSAKRRRLDKFEVAMSSPLNLQTMSALEEGRCLARDIGSADPERMTPSKLAAIVKDTCAPAGIKVDVIEDNLLNDYPLLSAVARASMSVERHRPCVVRMSWSGEGTPTRTICIAGKGVTYDTGGADLKVGGKMAGMRRDKCGAAAAAGFILACARAPKELTKGLRVLVELGCVRNSIGPDSYVADEIIVGHAGKRVLVGNTDMEGRMVLADCLSHLRETVLKEKHPAPLIISLATLTGHASLSYGSYAVALDNAAARSMGGVATVLAEAGTILGQPIEVGMVRREDFEFVAPGSSGTPVSKFPDTYDVLQTSTAASTMTARGHQFPAAFLAIASGLQEHGSGHSVPLPFCHVDLAGSVADARGVETGSPILPLFGAFVLGCRR